MVKRSPANFDLDYVKTDGKGRFTFENVPVGETIELHHWQRNYLRKPQTVVLGGGQKVLTVDVVLQPRPKGASVLVTVVGPDGKPVPNARLVNPSDTSAFEAITAARTTTGNPSSTMSTIFSAATTWAVTAKGFAPQSSRSMPGPPGKPSQLKVTLEPGHRIRGRVVLGPNRYGAGLRVFYAGGERGRTDRRRGDTDADGRFAIDSLAERLHVYHLQPPGLRPLRQSGSAS